MSEKDVNEPKSEGGKADAKRPRRPERGRPEGQAERWMKYGANVLMASVIVVLLAVIVIYLANARNLKVGKNAFSLRASADMTGDDSNSLKPQTVSVLRDLPNNVTLVSLYP